MNVLLISLKKILLLTERDTSQDFLLMKTMIFWQITLSKKNIEREPKNEICKHQVTLIICHRDL